MTERTTVPRHPCSFVNIYKWIEIFKPFCNAAAYPFSTAVGRRPLLKSYICICVYISLFVFVFQFCVSLLCALSQQRVDVDRCRKVMGSFSETSGQDHMSLIVIVFVFRVTMYLGDICTEQHIIFCRQLARLQLLINSEGLTRRLFKDWSLSVDAEPAQWGKVWT